MFCADQHVIGRDDGDAEVPGSLQCKEAAKDDQEEDADPGDEGGSSYSSASDTPLPT